MTRPARFTLAFLLALALAVGLAILAWHPDEELEGAEKAVAPPPSSPAKASAGREAQARPEERGKDAARSAASPAMLALRKATAAKQAWDLHLNIQKFEAGEFEEVWKLLLQWPDIPWTTQEMELAVSCAVRRGEKLEDVLALVTRDIPPGTKRNSLLEAMFGAMGGDMVEITARAESFSDPSEKAAAYVGIGTRISLSKSLAEIDPAMFEKGPPELLKALAVGLGDYSSQHTYFLGDEEKDAKLKDALAFAEGMAGAGHAGPEFVPDVIARMSTNRVTRVWAVLEQIRPGLIESDPRIFRPLLRAMASQEPEKLLDLSIQQPWVEAGAMRAATANWLHRDSATMRAWHDAHAASLTPERQARVAAGYADFHMQRGEASQAREWIGRIGDPKLREVVKADHARHHPENP